MLSHTRKVLVNDKGGNLMVLPLDQMLKGGNAPAAKSDSSGANNLLRLPPASNSGSSANSAPATSAGDIMDQRRVNAQRNDYQRQGGITMRKSVIAIIIIVLVVLYTSIFVVKEGERGISLRFGKVLRDDDNKPLVFAPVCTSNCHLLNRLKCWMLVSRPWITSADRFVTKEKKRSDCRLLH